jgi:hypothetical protein
MARLSRVTQNIFGSTAGFDQIAQFGSLAAGTPTFTTNLATIQSLSNYLVGWFNAVVGGNSPAIEDMNALFYLITSQLAYILQAGIPEWDAGTTYYTGDIVQSGGTTYVSLSNTNLNNAVTVTTSWFTPTQNGTVTPTAVPSTMILASGTVMSWPDATIGTGITVTVPSGSRLSSEGSIKLTGTGALIATGTGVVRIY